MPLLQRGIAFRYIAKAVQHLRRDDAAGQLDPDHLDIGLALPVHSLAEPERREHGVVQFPGAEAVNLSVEALDLVLHERDNRRRVGRQQHTGLVDIFQAGMLRLAGQGVLLGC